MNFNFTVQGIDELQASMRLLNDALERHIIGRGLFAMAGVVVQDARARVPVKTGSLRRSIRRRRTAERFRGRRIPGGSATAFAGGSTAPHGHLLELGTVKMAARPFIAPAILATREAQHRALVAETARELVKQVRRIATGTQSRAITRLIS